MVAIVFPRPFSTRTSLDLSVLTVLVVCIFSLKWSWASCQEQDAKVLNKIDISVISSQKIYACCALGLGSEQSAHCVQDFGTSESAHSHSDVRVSKLTEKEEPNHRHDLKLLSLQEGKVHFHVGIRRPHCDELRPVIISRDNLTSLFPDTSEATTTTMLLNGYLSMGADYFSPKEYCVYGVDATTVHLLICESSACSGDTPCIPKCCAMNEVYSLKSPGVPKGCTSPGPPGEKFFPALYHDYSRKLTQDEQNEIQPHFIHRPARDFKYFCHNNQTTVYPFSPAVAQKMSEQMSYHINFTSLKFRIGKDGSLIFRHQNGKCMNVSTENMCFEGIQNYAGKKGFNNTEDEVILFLCILPKLDNDVHVSELFGSLAISVSIFPLLTAIIYLLMWKKQNVHGWIIISTCSSLFFMYLFVGTSHVIRAVHGSSAHWNYGCTVLAIGSHFFYFAAFSWLTVMCFDLWWTFRTITPTNRRSKGVKRFVKYSIFGWGIPVTAIAISLSIDSMEDDCSMIMPFYGKESCFLAEAALGVYLYYPLTILLTVNVFFFGATCFKLYQYRENTKVATRNTGNQDSVSRFAKLFFVMGVTWIFEVISYCVDGLGFFWYWAAFDIINLLRAIAVFYIYVCKLDVLIALEEVSPCLAGCCQSCRRLLLKSDGVGKELPTASTAMSMQSHSHGSAVKSKTLLCNSATSPTVV